MSEPGPKLASLAPRPIRGRLRGADDEVHGNLIFSPQVAVWWQGKISDHIEVELIKPVTSFSDKLLYLTKKSITN